MAKAFNVNGACRPDRHYMVNLKPRLEDIKAMVDDGAYFTINKARQYGKTTTLQALAAFLKSEYDVVSLDFQRMSSLSFENEPLFVSSFAEELLDCGLCFPEGIAEKLEAFAEESAKINSLQALFKVLRLWCKLSEKQIVLMIDEIDTATNNQVFLDFLAQLRAAYLNQDLTPAFRSVILAGVYDVRNINRKIRPDEEHKLNSPWNIAADFLVDMSFSVNDIAGMLAEYEADYHTGMDIDLLSQLLHDYTAGYPYLVSRLCKFMDERIAGCEGFPDRKSAWTKAGFLEAEKILVKENNPLYQSLIGKLVSYPQLKSMLYELLFTGKPIPFVAMNSYIEIAAMLGFIRNSDDNAVISNRIFETVLYNFFLAEEFSASRMYDAGERDRNQFIIGGHLNVRKILEKFIETFDYLYGDQDGTFLEDTGRRYFMLFLKPIINGIENVSVEPETRNRERMDLVIYYKGEQYIIEMKIWHGNAYKERGEQQLSDYLDYFHLKKGYMLSFNFNQKKEIGVKEIVVGDKMIIEAVV